MQSTSTDQQLTLKCHKCCMMIWTWDAFSREAFDSSNEAGKQCIFVHAKCKLTLLILAECPHERLLVFDLSFHHPPINIALNHFFNFIFLMCPWVPLTGTRLRFHVRWNICTTRSALLLIIHCTRSHSGGRWHWYLSLLLLDSLLILRAYLVKDIVPEAYRDRLVFIVVVEIVLASTKVVCHVVLIVIWIERACLFKLLVENAGASDVLLLLIVELGRTLLAERRVSKWSLDIGSASKRIRSGASLLESLIVIHIFKLLYNR